MTKEKEKQEKEEGSQNSIAKDVPRPQNSEVIPEGSGAEELDDSESLESEIVNQESESDESEESESQIANRKSDVYKAIKQ